jgi:MFS family permease
MLWFICFFNYADRVAVSAVLPVLKEKYGFGPRELGAIGSAFTLVYALTAPFAGPVADRYPRKLVILAGLYIWSAITGFTALCTKAWQFVVVRGAEGLGETFYFPASMSLVSDYHGKDTRSRAMSFHQTSVYAGTIGGSALTGWIALKTGDWRIPFVIFAVAGIILGFVLSAFIREPRRGAADVLLEGDEGTVDPHLLPSVPQIPMREFLKGLWQTPTIVALIAGFFGANLIALVFLTWMPTFLKEQYKLNLAAAGLGATVYIQLASMVGAMLGGFMADHFRKRTPGGRMLVQASGLAFGAPFIFLCGYTDKLWTLVIAMTLFGLGKGVYDSNIWASLFDVAPASRRASAVGMMNLIGWTGGAIGAYGIGELVARGVSMRAAISSTAVIYALVAALLAVAALRFAPRDIARAAS